jgi:outer membrane immunogenic protein
MSVGKIARAPVLLAAMCVGLCAGTAEAGDPPRPGTSWSGFYVGGGIGSAWGETSWEFATGFTTAPNPFDTDGLVGSVHLGYQVQWGQIVAGVETSFTPSSVRGGPACADPTFSCVAETDWVWMLGPRLGYTSGGFHYYGTGGYAIGRIETRIHDLTAGGAIVDTSSHLHDGWYFGGGIEWAFSPALVLGIEYRRIELDTERHLSSTGDPNGARAIDATVDSVQARLTLKLGQ